MRTNNKFKALKLSIAVSAASLLYSPITNAVIPVTVDFDVTATLNQVQNYVQYVEQVTQLENQLGQMEEDFEAITGSRGLGSTQYDDKYRSYLPDDWQSVYDSINQGGYSGLTEGAKQIFDQYQIYDACSDITDTNSMMACQSKVALNAQNLSYSRNAFNTAYERLNQIESLMSEINSTTDPKAISEIQGRIAVETTAVQNEQTKLEMFQMVSVAEEKAADQRRMEIKQADSAKTEGFSIGTIDWD